MVSAETFRFREFAFARREGGHFAAVRGGKLRGHVPQSANADNPHPAGWFGMHDERREDRDPAAQERPGFSMIEIFRQRNGPGPMRSDVGCKPAAMTDN